MADPKCTSSKALELCATIDVACEQARAIHAAQCVALTSDTSEIADDQHDYLRIAVGRLLVEAQRAAKELRALADEGASALAAATLRAETAELEARNAATADARS